MNPDAEIAREVAHLLEHDPGLDATHISVEVKDRMVKLIGSVHSIEAKWMAKEAIKHVSGIKDVTEQLEVNPPSSLTRDEP